MDLKHSKSGRAVALFLAAVVATSLVGGAYLLVKRFLRDRESAMAHRRATAISRTQRPTSSTTQPDRNVDQSRPAAPPPAPPVQNPGEAAIQRQLRTLEEINRINETNRRLQEQQQRMQNQR